jgi:hypothetical protein
VDKKGCISLLGVRNRWIRRQEASLREKAEMANLKVEPETKNDVAMKELLQILGDERLSSVSHFLKLTCF